MSEPPIVIVGGLTSWPGGYREFAGILREISGSEVHVARITPLDWLRGGFFGFGQLVFEIASTVDRALIESESKEAILIGHSAGGIACRMYLGGDPPYGGRRYSGHRRVSPPERRRSTEVVIGGRVPHPFPNAIDCPRAVANGTARRPWLSTERTNVRGRRRPRRRRPKQPA